ncbi:Centromere protein F-like 1, partial [Homarus americanus]
MSWFGSASEWKQGLSSSALSKVEELENQTDEGTKEKQVLQKEIEQLARSCEQLQLQLQKGQYDHVTSSITLLPPRQPAVIDSLSTHTGEEMDSLRKKVDELLCENKDLQSKLSEQKMLHQCIDVCVTSTSAAVGDSDRDFWGNSSERSNKWSQRTPNKTPKKALETSEENPFKTPYQTLQSKGLGKSEGNLFKTPKKHHSTSSLLTIPPVPGPNDEYTKQLENMIDQYKKEIESLKSSSSSSPDTSKLQQEVTAMRTAIDKANTEFAVQEKALKAANEQLSTFKSAAEEAAGKLEKSEQRLRAVQNELDCQRHNSEAARKNLEDKFKGSERELNADITQAQNDMMNMERQMRDLQTKLQQQETLARNTQNSLQASLDKALAQVCDLYY